MGHLDELLDAPPKTVRVRCSVCEQLPGLAGRSPGQVMCQAFVVDDRVSIQEVDYQLSPDNVEQLTGVRGGGIGAFAGVTVWVDAASTYPLACGRGHTYLVPGRWFLRMVRQQTRHGEPDLRVPGKFRRGL